jgi:hypothetical protein
MPAVRRPPMRAAELRRLGEAAAGAWRLSRAAARRGGAGVTGAGKFASVRLAARFGLGAELAAAVVRSFETRLRAAAEEASVSRQPPAERRRAAAGAVTRVNSDEE